MARGNQQLKVPLVKKPKVEDSKDNVVAVPDPVVDDQVKNDDPAPVEDVVEVVEETSTERNERQELISMLKVLFKEHYLITYDLPTLRTLAKMHLGYE